MTNRKALLPWLALMTALALISAACGGDSDPADEEGADSGGPADGGADSGGPADGGADSGGPADGGELDSEVVEEEVPAAPVESSTELAEGMLDGVCPSPLVIQTDWFPEAEHGALYQLIPGDYTTWAGEKVVRGAMGLRTGPGDEDVVYFGIHFEIRTGGPAIGDTPVSAHMKLDDSIHLGYASTDSQIMQWAEAPLVSVVAPLERNPQMIMWDPETYPEVESIADLKDLGVQVNVFSAAVYPEVLVAKEILSEEQISPSYNGSPANFIAAGGAIAQQGFASAEVYTYQHTHTEWGKPVAFQLVHDTGFPIYSQTIGVRLDDLEELRPCLELLVPIIQRAVIAYDASPERANERIVDIVDLFADFWEYPRDLADFSVQAQREHGLIGNGPDSTVGNMEPDRIQAVLDAIRATGLADAVHEDLSAEDLYTNEFIDPGIGFPGSETAGGGDASGGAEDGASG